MSLAERFWWLLAWSGVLWYLTVTVWVAIRGAMDVRAMLRRLEADHQRTKSDEDRSST